MSLGELARPITIYWDITPLPPFPLDYPLICTQIKESKPLQLHLLDKTSPLSQPVYSILGQFQGTSIATVLTTVLHGLNSSCLDRLASLGLRGLLLCTASYSEMAGIPATVDAVGGRFATGVAFQVNRQNWEELPQVVEFCLEHCILSLTLPMQRLYDNESPLVLDLHEQTMLAESLAKLDYSSLRLTIHDPFLWRAFNKAIPFPGGGCQAANTMLAIAPDGTVYPCPTLPLPLGNLQTSTLTEILASTIKKDVRRMLLEPPTACATCEDLRECRGGCRGRSYVVRGELSGIDPACDKNTTKRRTDQMSISRLFALIVAVMTALLAGDGAFAQSGDNLEGVPVANAPAFNMGQRMKRLIERFALTAEQQALIKPILEEEVIKRQAVKADAGQNSGAYQTKLQELRDATAANIRPLLTPEQQQKYDVWRKELKKRRGKNNAGSV